jgi:general L-amino acid transport system permease protein
MPPLSSMETPRPPSRTVRRFIAMVKQACIVAAALGVLVWFGLSVRAGLARNGIQFNMGFLLQSANFDIAEGWVVTTSGLRDFVSSDTNAQALLVGFLNTIKTAVTSIVLATGLGVALGMARISRNWLLRQLSFGLVEVVRNTPMLIQLVFWYFAVILKMPALTDAANWFGFSIFSQQGIYLPAVRAASSVSIWSIWTLLATLVLVAMAMSPKARRQRTLYLALAAGTAIGTFALGVPLSLEFPHVDGLSVVGGYAASPEFSALLLGLSVYTAAFIAEIVRGAILSLPRGQWEAAAALGLPRRRIFGDIVLPQVFRVVLPAFGNQYISLAKTTSLGIAIGFPDLFNVYGTVANQSGRNLEGVIVVMLAYLVLSWVISAAVNAVNAKLMRKGGTK